MAPRFALFIGGSITGTACEMREYKKEGSGMEEYRLAEAESRFAELIWENEPIRSGELAALAAEKLSWKSTTSYTVLRRLCDRGIFKNTDRVVTSLISREQFYTYKSRQFVEDTFGGSLPRFLNAFAGGKGLDAKQVQEIRRIIDAYDGNEESEAACRKREGSSHE